MNNTKNLFDYNLPFVYLTLLLWVIKSAEVLFSIDMRFLAIHPREVSGLFGILFSPVLHASYGHLAANSLPLLLLGGLQAYGYPVSKWKTLLVIWLVSGIGVWLFGRPSIHLGASGLTSGLFYFLFVASIIRRDKVSVALMLIAVLLYGGILLGILPWDPKVSFEAHFFGALGGTLSDILFQKQDPKPQRKIYDWENEETDLGVTSTDGLDMDVTETEGRGIAATDLEASDKEEEYWKIGYSEKEPPK